MVPAENGRDGSAGGGGSAQSGGGDGGGGGGAPAATSLSNSVATKRAPKILSSTHVEAHQFRPILMDSSPEDRLMDLINNKDWDGHTVYDRQKGIFTTALYLAVEAENTSAISWLLEWSPTKVKDILEADPSNYGTTALHEAATIENPAIVSILLWELSDPAKQVNIVDKSGNTPLHTSVKRQNVKVIQALLRTGADPCQQNIKGEAPLHIAVKKGGNLEVLKKLLYRVAKVDTPDLEKGQTPLHLAVRMHLQMIKELELKELELKKLRIRQQEISRVEQHLQQQQEELSRVEQHLQEQQEELSLVEQHLQEQQEELSLVEQHLQEEQDMIVLLIAKGADPCRKDKEGASPLQLAALQGNESVFQLLLHTALKPRFQKACSVEDITNALEELRNQEDGDFSDKLKALKYGWNIHNVYADKTALHLASEFGNVSLVKALLNLHEKSKIHSRKQDELGNTALHFAASNSVGCLEIVAGESPLHLAVGQGEVAIVTALLEAGAEIDKKNKLGHTPLHYAVGQARADIARKLRDKGADFRLEDETGAGVLHFAARGGGKDIFALLDPKGLEVNRATKAGLTPLHFAAWNGNTVALEWLLKINDIKLDAEDKVEKGLPWHWAAMGGNTNCLRILIREHVKRKIQVFPGSHKDWQRAFQRIEDHGQADIIDWVPWWFLDNDGVLEPGILASAVAYGDSATNRFLARKLGTRETGPGDSVHELVEESRLLEWAALSATTRCTEFGGKGLFNRVKPVMEFVTKKYTNVKGINDQLRLAFKIAFSHGEQDELRGRETFATCMAKCFTQELPDMIKEAVWKELDTNFEDKYRKLPSKYKDAFDDVSELVKDVPVAYWEAKLEEDRSKDLKAISQENISEKKYNDEEGRRRKRLAQRLKQLSEKFIKDYPNDTGHRTGRTALHWAAIFMERETVITLSGKGCKPDICDNFGKPPYWDAQWVREKDAVMLNCLKWGSYTESLHKDRQMFVDGLNAILVGSALIASVTFGGFLNPPLGYKLKFKDREYVSIDRPGVLVFWVANSLSFFFAMASALAGVTGVLPSPDKFNLRLLRRLRHILIAAAVMLVISIIFVLVGFGAAGFSELAPSGKYQTSMIATSVPGGLVCLGPLCTFIYAVYNLNSRKLRFLDSQLSKAGQGSDGQKNTISKLVDALKRCFKVQDHSEVGVISFGSETLEELLSPSPSQSTPEGSPQRPKRYARGQRPWEDGLAALTQTDGETVITVNPGP